MVRRPTLCATCCQTDHPPPGLHSHNPTADASRPEALTAAWGADSRCICRHPALQAHIRPWMLDRADPARCFSNPLQLLHQCEALVRGSSGLMSIPCPARNLLVATNAARTLCPLCPARLLRRLRCALAPQCEMTYAGQLPFPLVSRDCKALVSLLYSTRQTSLPLLALPFQSTAGRLPLRWSAGSETRMPPRQFVKVYLPGQSH